MFYRKKYKRLIEDYNLLLDLNARHREEMIFWRDLAHALQKERLKNEGSDSSDITSGMR